MHGVHGEDECTGDCQARGGDDGGIRQPQPGRATDQGSLDRVPLVEVDDRQARQGKQRTMNRGDTRAVVLESCLTVGRPLFFSVLIMLISFLPVFALGGMEGRLFWPLALTKTFALITVAFLAIDWQRFNAGTQAIAKAKEVRKHAMDSGLCKQ